MRLKPLLTPVDCTSPVNWMYREPGLSPTWQPICWSLQFLFLFSGLPVLCLMCTGCFPSAPISLPCCALKTSAHDFVFLPFWLIPSGIWPRIREKFGRYLSALYVFHLHFSMTTFYQMGIVQGKVSLLGSGKTSLYLVPLKVGMFFCCLFIGCFCIPVHSLKSGHMQTGL